MAWDSGAKKSAVLVKKQKHFLTVKALSLIMLKEKTL